jgi:beta-ribofuranosylaminobenzene 5'-phosphate synthase
MSCQVTVTTGSRLHFGPLAHGAKSPPFFGGVGLMLDSPRFVVEFSPSEIDEVFGPRELTERADIFARQFREQPNFPALSACRIEIRESIPTHAGLGSGTQLGLAISAGLSALTEQTDISAIETATHINRGHRSAIGIHGFEQGGFLVDAGKMQTGLTGMLASRLPIPEGWRFVLVMPEDDPGFSGEEELAAFARLTSMPMETTNRLCRITLMHWLPAVQTADFNAFADSLSQFGDTVGDYFSEVQGGRFRHPDMRQLAVDLRSKGLQGIAQSSWGPTIIIAVESQTEAEQLSTDLRTHPACPHSQIQISAPRNSGANVDVKDC